MLSAEECLDNWLLSMALIHFNIVPTFLGRRVARCCRLDTAAAPRETLL